MAKKKGLGKGLLAVGSDGCMGSRQSAKLIEGTWVGLLMGERARKWTMEVQWVIYLQSCLEVKINN